MKILRGSLLILFVFSSSCLLLGCKEKQTYSYYMNHPQALQQAITECESNFQRINQRIKVQADKTRAQAEMHDQADKTKDQAEKCEVVAYAAVNMAALINQLQSDPEKFGQSVLAAQENYAKLAAKATEAGRLVEDLKNKQASPAELRAAQDDWYKAKKACAQQGQEIKNLLAVLGMSSPSA
jgi:outer membrane murein-binding lipoprotein Lpp